MMFRRPPRKPNIWSAVAAAVILGTIILVSQSFWGLYPVIEIEDPLDFDVPVSKGRSFESIDDDGRLLLGKPFPEETMERVNFLEEIKDSSIITFTNEEVLFVMYSSWENFREAREGLRQLRLISNNTIVFYDLGLTVNQLKDLKSVCNVEVIPYSFFHKWPREARTLRFYIFKPIIWAEMYQRSRAFWIFDTSVRLTNGTELLKFYEDVRLGHVEPMTFERPAGHSIDAATHKDMYSYLPLSQNGRQMGMWQTETMFIVKSKMSREIIKWSLLCALTKDCHFPENAQNICPLNTPCAHRFDQSSASIIRCVLLLRRNLSCLPANSSSGVFSSFATIDRNTKYDGELPAVC